MPRPRYVRAIFGISTGMSFVSSIVAAMLLRGTALVPALLVSHGLIFLLLLRRGA